MEEISKKTIDSIYRLIEKSRESGVIRKGTNETTKSIERGEAKFVAIAEDVNPKEIVMHIPMLCEEKKIPFAWVPKKAELGASAGLTAQASSVAIADVGEGKKLLSEILSDLEKGKKATIKKEEASKPEKKEESKEITKPAEEAPKEEKPKADEKEVKKEKPAKEQPKVEDKAKEVKEETKKE